MPTYSLCGDGKCCCPVVDVQNDHVRIGEDSNIVTLKKSEWKTLVDKIKNGEIK